MSLRLEDIDLHTRALYAERGKPWEAWDLLRREAPVHWYERDDIEGFWAITRHADILTVSRRSDVFSNTGRLRMALKGETEILRGGLDDFGKERGWDPDEPADMIFMDDPRHRNLRLLSSRFFTPNRLAKTMGRLETRAKEFTAEFAEALARDGAAGRATDFVEELAIKLPLAAICEIMELDDDIWKQIVRWTNAMVSEVEPEDRREGESVEEAAARAMNEFRLFIEEMVEERRALGRRRDDSVVDQLIHAEENGKPILDQTLIGYIFLLIGAGNETTRNATSGALIALLEHPDQMELLCAQPELVPSAVEECLRWTSPVLHFYRSALEDFELSGQKIAAGETVGMFYPSANRDERVFDEPYRFDIRRDPNPHLAFGGYGAHFCLGANLARAELRASLKELIPLLPKLELAGKPVINPNLHVPGYSKVPVRAKA